MSRTLLAFVSGVGRVPHSIERTTEPKLDREFFDSYASALPGLGASTPARATEEQWAKNRTAEATKKEDELGAKRRASGERASSYLPSVLHLFLTDLLCQTDRQKIRWEMKSNQRISHAASLAVELDPTCLSSNDNLFEK